MKKVFSYILFICSYLLFAQTSKGRWQDLFSYNNVKFIEEINGELYCGTENGIFVYHPNQDEYLKLNKTNVLNQVGISAMAYSSATKDLVIGYENGTIDIYNTETKTTKIVLDIPWNSYNGNKKINDILISNHIAFISGLFGIVSYDLNEKEFKETTFTNSISVNDATILGNTIYIATNNGIYSNELSDKNLNNPNFSDREIWKHLKTVYNNDLNSEEVYRIVNVNDKIYYTTNTIKYRYETKNNETIKVEDSRKNELYENFNLIKSTPNYVNADLKFSNGKLLITQINSISFLNGEEISINYLEKGNDGIIRQIPFNFNTSIIFNNTLYAGSTHFGLLNLENPSIYQVENPTGFLPDGPFNNQSYSVTAQNKKVWIAPGGMSNFNEPNENDNGFYYFNQLKWKHFKSKDLFDAKDFIKIAVNPTNDNHFFAIPYFEATKWNYEKRIGIIEFNLTNNPNVGNHIITPFKWLTRNGGGNFDKNGDFYTASSWVEINGSLNDDANYYYQKRGNDWKSTLSIKNENSNALSPEFSTKYVWYPNARSGGLTVLDKNMNEIVTLNKSNADLNDNAVLTVAVDKNNSVWIGTTLGLTVLNGGDNAIDAGNYKTEPIVIMQNGIPEALLTSIGINAIKVDKANRKWIATNSSGVFYVSSNGEQTIYHFTAKNSPLPSDIVYDISIDDSTGKVYFATEKGVVVFNGDVQDVGNNFNKAIAYPNPVRPGFKGNVTIKNLPESASVKITDIVGNLLFEAKASGGIVEWDTKNSKGKEVASGIYLVLMTNTDGTETKTLKIAVVR